MTLLPAARAAVPAALRRHWLFAVLLTAGFVLRLLAVIAYRPALLYIDSAKYLYSAYPGADPVGYQVPLKMILAAGDLSAVAIVQHLLGLAIAVTLYLVLAGRGIPRWLAALAAAPVLLDAYQIQIEQTIMPDVWFEGLVVAGLAVLLARDGEGAARRLRAVAVAGLLIGVSATFRQVGEILVLPALAYLVAAGGTWRTIAYRAAAFTAAFALPIGAYTTGSALRTGHFWLDSATPSLSAYGRMATAADCAALRIPRYERPLCPTPRQRAFGIDWLDHDASSPLKTYLAPAGMNRFAVIAHFDHQVLAQQPGRVLAAIAGDSARLFAPARTASADGTPISRWQFQRSYPTYGTWVSVRPDGAIVLGLYLQPAGGPLILHQLDRAYGGHATVTMPVAALLRSYQLGGGFTPGPLLALLALSGLLGSAVVFLRRVPATSRRQARACLLFFASGLAVLAISDAFQFSWRYQLPALVMLPPAGVLGGAAVAGYLAGRRPRGEASGVPDQVAQLTSPAA